MDALLTQWALARQILKQNGPYVLLAGISAVLVTSATIAMPPRTPSPNRPALMGNHQKNGNNRKNGY